MASRQGRFILCIELCQPHAWFEQASCLLECGRHHPAGAAPGSPEVHQKWQAVFPQVRVEVRGPQFEGTSLEQSLMALATARSLAQSPRWYSIDSTVMRACDVDGVAHPPIMGPHGKISNAFVHRIERAGAPDQSCPDWGPSHASSICELAHQRARRPLTHSKAAGHDKARVA
jgi:hypothetical protein